MKSKSIQLMTVVMAFFLIFTLAGSSAAKQAATADKAKAKKMESIQKVVKKKPVFRDDGSSGVYDPGVDLVVSKVVMERGVFGSNPDRRIKIVAYVKNMWHGTTRERIKVLFDGLGRAVWIEGGIRSLQEKSSGAIYLSDDGTGEFPLQFGVEVDNNNTIDENNETNNRCENIEFAPDETRRTHQCPPRGPHDRMI